MNNRISLPAEWQAQQAVIIAWPHILTDWNYMLDEVTLCYRNLAEAISRFVPLVIVAPEPDSVKIALYVISLDRISII
ncbi:MAG: agmatine deiminase family protein, partial [Muribaculaceae bacterium]|nr:agmatine deiminase family protein [Muribaculaceae bacterium]